MSTLIHEETGVNLRRVTRSEWTKLRSLRSTWMVLVIMAVLSIGLAGGAGWAYEGRIADGEVTADPTHAVGASFLALELLGLVIGVLGVLQMSGEYSSGLIRASLAAVPRRLPLLWAKALVLIAMTFPFMVVVCFGCFFAVQVFAPSDGTTLSDPGVLRAVLGAAAYPVAIGLLGVGIGTLVRHTAAAVTALVAAVLVLPALSLALPDSARDAIAPYQPVTAGQAVFAMERTGQPVDLLSPGAGALVMVGWVVLLLAAGAFALRRRDA